ncbi:MAG: hypothetical protein JO202_18195 [Ktedonobacteraceae bacterium]|nr:hypothetical protein [Ktedonobacteraceae bacterium]
MRANIEPPHLKKAPRLTVAVGRSFTWKSGLLDILVIAVMCFLLYYGASWQIFRVHTDAAKYQCYAVAFWQGLPALKHLSVQQCGFITDPSTAFVRGMRQLGFSAGLVHFVVAQNVIEPFHVLPYEYPLLALAPFSLGLIASSQSWYQVAFALCMTLIAALIYLLLVRYRSRRAAIVCAIYLVAGGWGTAAGRFDLVPSAFTLLAVICATTKRWNWAFAALALGVLLKLYPVVLLPPFLIAQQMESRERWYCWRRLVPLGVFVAICAVVTTFSLLLSVQGTLAPLGYFKNRPFQIESSWASLFWLLQAPNHPLHVEHTYGSLNVLSPLSAHVALWSKLLPVGTLLYVYWLQWRRKIDLAASSLLTLLVVILTGKVFSPQYLLWVAPLVAYVGEDTAWWLLPWTAMSLLTTWIYPYIYSMVYSPMGVPGGGVFYLVVAVRNALMLGFIIALLFYYWLALPRRQVKGEAA